MGLYKNKWLLHRQLLNGAVFSGPGQDKSVEVLASERMLSLAFAVAALQGHLAFLGHCLYAAMKSLYT